jgi:hypothetical protein
VWEISRFCCNKAISREAGGETKKPTRVFVDTALILLASLAVESNPLLDPLGGSLCRSSDTTLESTANIRR